MTYLGNYLNNIAYFFVLCCLIAVSFSVSLETYHPFGAIKELLFHLFVLLAGSFIVVRAILTSTFPLKKDPLYVFAFLYVCYNAFSFALSPYADKVYFINLTLLILFFFIVAVSVNSEQKISYLLYTIAFIVGISSIYGIFQFYGYDYAPFVNYFRRTLATHTRVYAFFGNPNIFAAILVMSLPLLLAGFLTKQRVARYLLGTCTLLAIASLLLTGTRTALLGASISVVLFWVIGYGKAHKKRYLWAVSTTVVLIVAGFFYTATVPLGSPALDLRKYWWQNTFEIVRDYPLLGTGVGSFNVYYPAHRKRSMDIALGFDTGPESRQEHAHNEFLEILSDLGILGFLLFGGVLFTFFHNYYVQWDPKNKYLVAGNCSALIGIIVHNLYSQNLRFVCVALFFWLNLALQSALLSEPKTEEKTTLNAGRIIASLLLLSLPIMIFFNHSIKIYSDDFYLQKGLSFFGAQDFQTAGAHFKKAAENNPQDKFALSHLAMSQFRLEKFPESKDTLRKLIQLDPNYPGSHYWLANNYFMTQDFEKAKAEYQEALRVDDVFGPSYYDLGLIAVAENDIQQALDYFEQAQKFGNERLRANASNYLEKLRELNR